MYQQTCLQNADSTNRFTECWQYCSPFVKWISHL